MVSAAPGTPKYLRCTFGLDENHDAHEVRLSVVERAVVAAHAEPAASATRERPASSRALSGICGIVDTRYSRREPRPLLGGGTRARTAAGPCTPPNDCGGVVGRKDWMPRSHTRGSKQASERAARRRPT
eukprot:7247140-Prymnesium_polylepis.1